jgi:hypothetical protein
MVYVYPDIILGGPEVINPILFCPRSTASRFCIQNPVVWIILFVVQVTYFNKLSI